MTVDNKTIFITGASSGLGKGLALYYAKPQNTLLLLARNENRLQKVVTACRHQGARVESVICDVRDEEKLSAWIKQQDEKTPIDLMIANAGMSKHHNLDALHKDRNIFVTNVFGVLNTIHPIIPRMTARGRGQIALISSIAAFTPIARAAAYCASKAALKAYGEALYGALMDKGVFVSVVCPGFIDTPLIKKNKFKMPGLMSVNRAASIIAKGLQRKKPFIIFPKRLYFAAVLFSHLPVRWRQRMTHKR